MTKEQYRLVAQIAYRRVLQGAVLSEEDFGHLFEQMAIQIDNVLDNYGVKEDTQ